MRRMRRALSLLMCGMFFVGILFAPMNVAASDVKVSDVNYKVSYEGAKDIFLFNKRSVGSAVGTEVWLTYTVDEVTTDESKTQGVAATGQPKTYYPYVTGQMEYDYNKQLLEEGYTYFFKFKVTDDGFEQIIIKAKGEESSYLDMTKTTGNKTDALGYFGLWLGGGTITAKLSKVRCYDRNGNDLGIDLSRLNKASYTKDVSYDKNTSLNHYYDVTIKDKKKVALCSQKSTTSDKVYIEYTVKSSKTNIIQTGALITQEPSIAYPYSSGNGYMLYEQMKEKGDGNLLLEGADYIICIEKKTDGLDVTVQRTYKGEKALFSFPNKAGEYSNKYPYFGLYFGDGKECSINCVLTNFKCYDSNNNNLGVQCNTSFTSEHFGEIEDYAGCDAVYYCKEDGSAIVLYQERKMSYIKNGVEAKGTYQIADLEDKVITLSYGEGKEAYSYLYQRITSEDGKVYERLGTYKVSFVTGSESKIEKQILSAENGYIVRKPEEPQKKGVSFVGWVTRDGKDFDFDATVTKSMTLYAKWSDDDGREIIAVLDEGESIGFKPVIAGLACVFILGGSIAGAILFVRKGGKHEKEQ